MRKVQVSLDARVKHGVLVVDVETGEDLTERCQSVELLPGHRGRARLLVHRDGRPYYVPERDEVDFEIAVVTSLSLGLGSVFGGEHEGKTAVHRFAVPGEPRADAA